MKTYIKALLFLGVFSVLHFGYELTGWKFLIPICGINESVFQHLKMAFWAYIISSALERIPSKGKTAKSVSKAEFWYSRLLSAVIVPWLIFILWYFLPAVYGRAKSLFVDLCWSLLATFTVALFAAQLEQEIQKLTLSKDTRLLIIFLVVASGFLFVFFTFKLPWIDLFINPATIP